MGKVYELSKRTGRHHRIAGIYITDDCIYWRVGSVRINRIPYNRYRPIIVDDIANDAIKMERKESFEALTNCARDLAKNFPGIRAIGVGCFGPFDSIDIRDRPAHASFDSPGPDNNYGRVQPQSIHHQLAGNNVYEVIASAFLEQSLPLPDIRIQTDVAVSAFADCALEQINRYSASKLSFGKFEASPEHRRWVDNYVTVCLKASRGVGGAVISQRDFWPPARFSEMGQIHVPRYEHDVLDRGTCAFHSGCLEGYICEDAIIARLKKVKSPLSLSLLRADAKNDIWRSVAYYAAQMCLAITVTAAPERVILTGRLLRSPGLVERVQKEFGALMRVAGKGMYPIHRPTWNLKEYIRAPLERIPGPHGAIFFAASFVNEAIDE